MLKNRRIVRISSSTTVSFQVLLVKPYLKKMEMVIQPGLGLYTWKSTVLDNYVKNITSKLDELICLLYQINEIFKKLEHNISSIESLNFLPVKNITTENITCEVRSLCIIRA